MTQQTPDYPTTTRRRAGRHSGGTTANHHTGGDDRSVGTAPWVQRTSGRLTTAERRALLRPLARTHVQNAVGRLRLAVGLQPGRNAY